MSGAPAAAYHGTVVIADHVEAQTLANNTGQGIGGAKPTWNVVTTPSVDLGVFSSDRWNLTFRYAPIITARQLEGPAAVDALNTGALGLAWVSHRTRVSVDEIATIGKIDYATNTPGTGAAGQPAALQLVPVNQLLTTASSRSTATIAETFTRRFSGSITGGYAMSGGVDETSRATLPFQRGPVASAHAEYALARRDLVVADFDYLHADFTSTACTNAPTDFGVTTGATCTPRIDDASIAAGLLHRLSHTADATLQGGFAAVASRQSPDSATTFTAYPVAIASVVQRTGVRRRSSLDFTVSTRISPVVAQLTGVVDERLQGDAAVDVRHENLLVHGLARASQSIPGTVAGSYFDAYGEGSVGYRFNRTLEISVGERLDYQIVKAGPSVLASFGFARATVTSRMLRF